MRKKVIIDCDPGIDDSLALMLALSMEEIEVLGITVVCGNVPVELGFANAKKVLKHMGRLDIPVYVGEARPLRREYVSAQDTHGEDGLGESWLPDVPGYGQELSAVSYIIQTLREERCSLLALGPMTNLARALMADEEAFSCLDEMVSMGGNFKSHGNCSPVAEYNYWCDPDAAAFVYEKMAGLGKTIHMDGLDVTRKIVLTPDLLAYLRRLDEHHGAFVEAITKFYFDFHWEWEHIIGCVINDPLAVAYFVDRSLCSGFAAYTAIETGGISMGQSVVDQKGFLKREPNSFVLTKTDALKFFYLFFSRLLHRSGEELDLLEQLC